MNLRSKINLMGITGTSGNIKRDFTRIHANLNREILRIGKRTNKGLLLAAIEVRRDMEVTPPLIPVDFGNLRASWYITTKKTADPTLKPLQTRKASFKKAATPEILHQLREDHKEALSNAEVQLSRYPIGVMMGFSANYTAPVHEMMDDRYSKPINWSRPGSGPKFFQAALYRNFDKIVTIVKFNAQVRP